MIRQASREPNAIAESLRGGDRRSIGGADRVAALVVADGSRFAELWDCLRHADPLVRMRASDALEKVSRRRSELLQAHKRELLSWELDDGTAEVRWHLIAMAARLVLSPGEAAKLMASLSHHLHTDESRIVKVAALQAAVEIGATHQQLHAEAQRLREWTLTSPWPSLRTRARKLGSRVQKKARTTR